MNEILKRLYNLYRAQFAAMATQRGRELTCANGEIRGLFIPEELREFAPLMQAQAYCDSANELIRARDLNRGQRDILNSFLLRALRENPPNPRPPAKTRSSYLNDSLVNGTFARALRATRSYSNSVH